MAIKNTVIDETSMKELRKKPTYLIQKEIVELQKSSQVSIIEIGKRLVILKETKIPVKQFRKFIEEDAKLGYDIANKYMKIVRRYGIDTEHEENSEIVIALGVKKADKLLRIVDLDTRMKYIEENDLVHKSFKELSDLLDKDFPGEVGKVKILKPWTLGTNIENSINTNIRLINDNMKSVNNNLKSEMKSIKIEMEQTLIKIQALNVKLQELKSKEEEEKKKAKDKNTEKATS